MFSLNSILRAIRTNRIRITDHADEEAQSDQLQFEEIFYAVEHGEIIEEYSSDRP